MTGCVGELEGTSRKGEGTADKKSSIEYKQLERSISFPFATGLPGPHAPGTQAGTYALTTWHNRTLHNRTLFVSPINIVLLSERKRLPMRLWTSP